MAVAKQNTKKIKKMVETEVDVKDGVTLTLSNAEAKAFMLVWSKIGGCPSGSARGYLDNIAFQGRGSRCYLIQRSLSLGRKHGTADFEIHGRC